jgi:hypothetical protein
MSPTPTRTVPVSAAVWNVDVGPVADWLPSLAVAYHSNVWPPPRFGHSILA